MPPALAERVRLDDALLPHMTHVLSALPAAVLDDLADDPHFRISDYDPSAGWTHSVVVGIPRRGQPARAVVLKRSLARRPQAFIRWVIAHELAHAHLRNRGRVPGEDPEFAADALAELWGFPRPR